MLGRHELAVRASGPGPIAEAHAFAERAGAAGELQPTRAALQWKALTPPVGAGRAEIVPAPVGLAAFHRVQPYRAGLVAGIGLDGGDPHLGGLALEADIERGADQVLAAERTAVGELDDNLSALDRDRRDGGLGLGEGLERRGRSHESAADREAGKEPAKHVTTLAHRRRQFDAVDGEAGRAG